MSRDLADLHPCLRSVAAEFVGRCAAAGLPVIITQTRRTEAEQWSLYEQGRSRPGKVVTNAKPGESAHCPPGGGPALAFDVAFHLDTGEVTWNEPRLRGWDEIGAIGASLGLQWGGYWTSFPDRPHFEWPQWRKVAAGGDPTGGSGNSGAPGGS